MRMLTSNCIPPGRTLSKKLKFSRACHTRMDTYYLSRKSYGAARVPGLRKTGITADMRKYGTLRPPTRWTPCLKIP